MRRRSPDRLGSALDSVVRELAPPSTLARVQRAWPAVSGETIAAHTEPVAERAGVVTIACESAVWAQELELLASELLARLNQALAGPDGGAPLEAIRVSARPPASRS
jgi:predicted nucleic acid-binding Zn ribbon protein